MSIYVINPYIKGYEYLLDQYPGAVVAFSPRKLRSSYAGPCMRIRRDTDNAQLDVYFVNNYLDIDAITSFCGSGSGFITVYYDQSGNGNNATNSTLTYEPQIYASGSLRKKNGVVCPYWYNYANLNFTRVSSIRSLFITCRPGQFLLGDSSTYHFHNDATYYFNTSNASSYIKNGSLFRNSVQISPTTTPLSIDFQLLSLFPTGPVQANQISKDRTIQLRSHYDYVGDIIIYYSDVSSLRDGIEENINSYYKLY